MPNATGSPGPAAYSDASLDLRAVRRIASRDSVPSVEFRRIDKSFGAVAALDRVSFQIEDGSAHAIVGENGAGKSTLLKVLAGAVRPDRGELVIGGVPAAFGGARDALANGIGLVHQEMLAFPNLSVTANIFAGRELTSRLGRLRGAEMRSRAGELLQRLHLPVSPDAPVDRLPPAYRQLLQVARALAFDCRVLALDEPTTSLTAGETDHLFRVLEDLKRGGVTVIYVSHRLAEVFRLCDRITVLRDGAHIATFDRRAVTTDGIVHAMVGRAIHPRASVDAGVLRGEPLLAVERLTRRPWFEDVTLTVRAGEIVGLFGLVGSGRTELLETLIGIEAADAGHVEIGGTRCRFRSPRDAARAGVALVPEDRQLEGLFFNLTLRHNLMLPSALATGAILVRRRELARSAALLRQWRVKAPSAEAAPDSLSGGNQQKVALARWLALEPRVLLLDEPTKGVDVGAKYEIHEFIREVAGRGGVCLVVSSDLPEVLTLANRIVVMREGRLRGELLAAGVDEERVMRLAAGSSGEAA
jgi:rhamnose transport system ATP-binding protein